MNSIITKYTNYSNKITGFSSGWFYIIALLLLISSFTLHYIIEMKFEKLEVFDQWNVLFNADVNNTLGNISHNWGNTGTSHLNIANFFNPPIRIVAKVISVSGISGLDEESIRHNLALFIIPLLGALKTVLILMIFSILGLKLFDATLLAIIDTISFSQIIFGSIPDHFPISGFLFAILFYMATITIIKGYKYSKSFWYSNGVLLFGITITNIIPFATVFFLTYIKQLKLRHSFISTIKIMISIVVINLIVFFLVNFIYNKSMSFNIEERSNEYVYFRSEVFKTAMAFPSTLSNTLIGTNPPIAENKFGIINNDKYKIMFTYENSPKDGIDIWDIKDIVIIIIIFVSILGLLKSGDKRKLIAYICLCIIAFNWILHSFYGDELFLYSQHWQVPLLILLSGLLYYGLKGRVVLLLITLFMALNNLRLVVYMLDTFSKCQ